MESTGKSVDIFNIKGFTYVGSTTESYNGSYDQKNIMESTGKSVDICNIKGFTYVGSTTK